MQGAEFLIPVSFFAGMFGIFYIYFQTRHRERMALIEKGASPDIFHSTKRPRSFSTLKFGLLFVGVALGILTGALLSSVGVGMREETANFSMIFLFGGLALIVNHVLESKRPEEDQRNKG